MSGDLPDLPIRAAGGWCAPSETIYDTGVPFEDIFPVVSVTRGGIKYHQPTDEERRAQEAWQAHVQRVVRRVTAMRDHAIETAIDVAVLNGWDVHVYEPPTPFDMRHADSRDLIYMRHVGIEFTPGRYSTPVVHFHPCPDYWDEDD